MDMPVFILLVIICILLGIVALVLTVIMCSLACALFNGQMWAFWNVMKSINTNNINSIRLDQYKVFHYDHKRIDLCIKKMHVGEYTLEFYDQGSSVDIKKKTTQRVTRVINGHKSHEHETNDITLIKGSSLFSIIIETFLHRKAVKVLRPVVEVDML